MQFNEPNSLPKYTDDEVKSFHPVLGYCLQLAIKSIREDGILKDDLFIEHHKRVGSLQMDFAILRAKSKRIFLPIEVKRTPASVSSTRYRNQARTYVVESGKLAENQFYVLTNLEITELYKNDQNRPSVIEQLIEPGTINIGLFRESKVDEFLGRLTEVFKNIIIKILKDNLSYNDKILLFSKMLSMHLDKKWHESLIPGCFEYVRGALKNINTEASTWRIATFFRQNPKLLITKGLKINFKNIFKEPLPTISDSNTWDSQIISELYKAGASRKTGDDLEEIIHYIVSEGRETEGVIATDNELARLLGVLMRVMIGRKLKNEEIVCDPAAGSGSLLVNLLDFFPKLTPKQIWANDKEVRFQEGLSLRLGLLFPYLISEKNSPTITCNCISRLKPEQFKDVSLVVLNPPFISGARNLFANSEKEKFKKAIIELKGNSKLVIGQIGVEGPFVELIVSLIKKGTICGFIVPKRYLTARGPEAIAFREFLINDFGLEIMVTYPREGLFEEVMKSTAIVIGKKRGTPEAIKGISIDIPLEQIDLQELLNNLNNNKNISFPEPVPGVFQRIIKREIIINSIDKGWRIFFGHAHAAKKWIDSNLGTLFSFQEIGWEMRRGRVGNSGLSDLIYISSNKKIWDKVKSNFPETFIFMGIKKSNQSKDAFLKRNEDYLQCLALPSNIPIEYFYKNDAIKLILKEYSQLAINKTVKQKKKLKSFNEILKILKNTSKCISKKGTILVPRNIRRFASAFILNRPCLISTNFIEIIPTNNEEGLLFLSWILSIFGQLQFEICCQDQEGTRKIEKNQLLDIKMPVFSKIPTKIINKIKKEMMNVNFLDLYNIELRPIDCLWSKYLFGELYINKAYEAKGYLEELILERNPQKIYKGK